MTEHDTKHTPTQKFIDMVAKHDEILCYHCAKKKPIVRACNSYDALVSENAKLREALKESRRTFSTLSMSLDYSEYKRTIDAIWEMVSIIDGALAGSKDGAA